MNYLVTDFGGTLAKYSIMNENCEIYKQAEHEAPLASKESFLDFLCQLYEENRKEYKIAGIAVSMPGVIDEKQGIIRSAGAYLELYGMHLKEELKDRIPVPVSVENDGKCGALAEVWRGNLKDCQDGIVLILGTAVAGGIIKDRKIHKGKNLSAGEFSYMLLGDEPSLRDTALLRCSVSALLFRACLAKGIDAHKMSNYDLMQHFFDCEQKLSSWDEAPEYAKGMDGYQFFELLEKGDQEIRKLYEEYIANLAKLVLNLQLVYAPEKILIGGGISRQPRLVKDIRAQYEKLQQIYMGVFSAPCEIETCYFENIANQYGALYLFLEENDIGSERKRS